MSRFTGPRVKKLRALGVDLPGLSRKTYERRPFPPGVHGQSRRRRESDYARQLKEKQKLRFNYGVGERQFRRLMIEARASKADTGKKLLELLERRLDNVVFRAGFAPTIPAARQLVNHSHFTVNGRKVNIPSFRVKEGDVVELRARSQKVALITETLAAPSLLRPDWLDVDVAEFKFKVTSLPDETSVPFEIEISNVVEYYARLI